MTQPMLMHVQNLYKSPAIVSMVTADYYYPDWDCLSNILPSGVEKIAGMAGDWIHNLSSFLLPLSHGS